MITKKHIKYLVVSVVLGLSSVCCDEKSSLTFVIDDTSSMHNDIEQVKNGVNDIFDTVLNSNESHIEDFVLVTFNDPDTKLKTITNDRKVFKDALSSIIVHGGGLCPEYSMAGIMRGIMNSRLGSTIYVFTDASSSDYSDYDEVKNIAIKKQIQVVFVLTGFCDSKNTPHYKVYEQLAAETNGQIFNLGENDISEILNYVMENLKGRRTTLASASFPPGSHSITFTLDSKVKVPIISVTGEHKPDLSVIRPDGNKADTKPIVDKDEISIIKILEPLLSGIYTALVSSTSKTHVVVSGRTEVKFQHGFSTFKPTSIKDTTTTPLPDVKSHITIKLTDGDIELKTVKILDMKDTLIKEIPLVTIDGKEQLYATELEDLPNTMFKIAITGYDPKSNTIIIRVGSPISPQPKLNPAKIPQKAPIVTILGPPTLNVEWEAPVQLKCKVNGYPQPNIVWVNKNSGEELPANVSVVELDNEFISILDIEKVVTTTNYQCKADNVLGSDSTSVAVNITVKPHFNILMWPNDKTIKYLDSGNISCQVDAYPPATITWYKNWTTLQKDDNLEFSDDNSVFTIKEMHVSNGGVYTCEVRNAHNRKILGAKLTITGVESPIIDDHTTAIATKPGADVVITCNLIRGFPKPEIKWYYQSYSGENILLQNGNIDNTQITIKNPDKESTGTYACLAENESGNDYHEVYLTVEYPVTIKDDVEEIKVAVGKSIVMPCDVEGDPEPVVTWYKDNIPMKKSKNIYIYKNHSVRMTVDSIDSGTYTCNAVNKFGNVSRVIKVEVYDPPTITVPNESKMIVGVGTTLNLPCQTMGYPIPNTQWTYYSFNPNVTSKLMLTSLGSSFIKLRNIQPGEEGYYTCTANNTGGSTNLTYEIHVLAPPKLEKIYMDNSFKAVEGDLVMRIECKATGNPPPVIKWLKNGFWVATGDDYIIENGTIILKNLSKDDEGIYVCEAKNNLDFERVVYHVFVDKSPQQGPPTATVVILQGYSAEVLCGVPHRRTDQLRWYKDGVQVHSGELKITNAQLSDSGLYTCRVSNFTTSISGNTLVKIVLKPRFNTEEEENIEYVEGNPLFLNCETIGDPKPQMTWWHDGEIMNITSDYLYFDMELGTHGKYTCEARNDVGIITRSFNVISKDCIIDIKIKSSKLQPLMLSKEVKWPQNIIKNGYMSITKKDYVAFLCPNRFKKFPNKIVTGFCEGGSKFKINGQIYEHSEMECTQKVTHILETTGVSCFPDGNTEIISVAFSFHLRTIEAYEVCFDKDNNVTLYTTVHMRNSVADVDYSGTEWADREMVNLNHDDAYECNRKINTRRWYHRDDGCCFAKRMLVSPKDLFPGVPQRSAYSHLNVVPHWSTCNAESNNWNEVEQRVRSLAKATYSELVVTTGVAEKTKMPGGDKDILHDMYLWKVVQDPETKSSLVIIQVNVPDLLPSEAPTYVRCRDICNDTKWMTGSNWYDVQKGFTYCCSLPDFEVSFGYSGVFEPFDQVLSDVSLIPKHSLT